MNPQQPYQQGPQPNPEYGQQPPQMPMPPQPGYGQPQQFAQPQPVYQPQYMPQQPVLTPQMPGAVAPIPPGLHADTFDEDHNHPYTMAVLLSLFLGGLGIDRFYLGYKLKGVLKLLTVGGFGLWYLADVFRITWGGIAAKDNDFQLEGFPKSNKIFKLIVSIVVGLQIIVSAGIMLLVVFSTTSQLQQKAQEQSNQAQTSNDAIDATDLPVDQTDLPADNSTN